LRAAATRLRAAATRLRASHLRPARPEVSAHFIVADLNLKKDHQQEYLY
jgi:hypothetical protein